MRRTTLVCGTYLEPEDRREIILRNNFNRLKLVWSSLGISTNLEPIIKDSRV